MATCRETVSGALRKIGRLGAGREPRAADQADVLAALQGLYRQWINGGAFGRLSDVVPTGAAYTARENERIFRNASATVTITLPETVATVPNPRSYRDEVLTYEGITGNTRPPRDCAVVVISDAFTATTVEYIYDGSQRLWQAINALALADTAPLSVRDPMGLQAALAMQIADEFGAEVGAMTQRQAATFQMGLTHRYSTPREASSGVFV